VYWASNLPSMLSGKEDLKNYCSFLKGAESPLEENYTN
jgi:hypothetical protein